MKNILFSVILFFGSISAVAQQALWGGSPIISPEINADKSVTFRLHAPNAQLVEITGDFLPKQSIDTSFGKMEVPGTISLTKNAEQIWEYTTPSLSPELYSYNFMVDGLKITDPSNVFQIRDVSSIFNIFIVPGEQADLYKVNAVPHGSVTKRWHNSPTFNI